jgi:hypothetical protein
MRGRQNGERGSVLILAFVYLTAVGLTVAALAGWAANDLRNTTRFTSVRALQDANRSAVETALQTMRYTPLLGSTQTLNASPPNFCWGNGPLSQLTIDGYTVDTFCSTAWTPTSAQTRVVSISSCLDTGKSATLQATACVADPYLRVVVTYDDYPPGGSVPISGSCTLWSWCGEGQTINSWIWA